MEQKMSWNGAIPHRKFRVKGLRNKRNKKSTKAILARLAKMEKRDKGQKRPGGRGPRDSQWGDQQP